MTREEEYTQAASDYILSPVVPVGSEKLAYGDFINGVKWADKHPKKGLWDSKKVIEFIKNVREYHKSGVFHVDDFIDDLTKAMEE